MAAFIEVERVSFIYNNGSAFEKKALDDVSVTIEKGEFIGLIGHTGSGKSTLIQHLNALVKPTKGRILLNGEDINSDKSKLKEIRQKIGLLFQYPEHQLFEMTIKEDVAFGPKNLSLSRDEIEKRVHESLSAVGISEELYDKSPFELSGGQKRRVAIAGVLAMNPEVLILDEPAAGLDPRGRDEILFKIKEMREKLNITVLLVSHSMEDIGRLVDRIIVINRGKIAMTGTPKEVFKHADLLEGMGLAAPQATYLSDALKKDGFLSQELETIYTVEAAVEAIDKVLSKKMTIKNGGDE